MHRRLKTLIGAGLLAIIGISQASAACLSIATSGNLYMLINNCPYTVSGNYEGSLGAWGGFGPIPSGGSEVIGASAAGTLQTSYCNYDDWLHDICKPGLQH